MVTAAKITKNVLFWGAVAMCLLLSAFSRFVLVGYSFTSLIFLALAGLLVCYWLLGFAKKKWPRPGHIAITALSACLALGLTVCAITGFFIVRESYFRPVTQEQYVVVLGCGIHGSRPSKTLTERVNAAAEYLQQYPDAICVASGGQGEGEDMTEAACIRGMLVSRGIDPDRIWLEERSTSTEENLAFSMDVIQEKTGTRPETIAVVSSEFHMLRAKLFARQAGAEATGVPAETEIFPLRINYFLREIAGVWHYLLLGGN